MSITKTVVRMSGQLNDRAWISCTDKDSVHKKWEFRYKGPQDTILRTKGIPVNTIVLKATAAIVAGVIVISPNNLNGSVPLNRSVACPTHSGG